MTDVSAPICNLELCLQIWHRFPNATGGAFDWASGMIPSRCCTPHGSRINANLARMRSVADVSYFLNSLRHSLRHWLGSTRSRAETVETRNFAVRVLCAASCAFLDIHFDEWRVRLMNQRMVFASELEIGFLRCSLSKITCSLSVCPEPWNSILPESRPRHHRCYGRTTVSTRHTCLLNTRFCFQVNGRSLQVLIEF